MRSGLPTWPVAVVVRGAHAAAIGCWMGQFAHPDLERALIH